MDESRQGQFPFMNICEESQVLSDHDKIQAEARLLAAKTIEELREPLFELVHEAIRRDLHNWLDYEAKCLLSANLNLTKIAIAEFLGPVRDKFNEIARANREEMDQADWWKRGSVEDEEDYESSDGN